MHRLLLFLATALTLATAASAQTYSGRLDSGDDQLNSGEYVDEYSVVASTGQAVTAVLTSDDFDTYVIVKSPTGEQQDNDDCTEGETTRSCATFVADQEGRVRILVTSYGTRETGDYTVVISVGGEGGSVAPTGRATLADGDAMLQSGEHYDAYTVLVGEGQQRRITLMSTEFDPYLIATGPGEARVENDDCTEDDTTLSCIVLDAPGEWDIFATSFAPGATGEYMLNLGETRYGSATGSEMPDAVRVENGQLAAGDETLQSGEFSDVYTVIGTGGPLVADLRSSDFDPYLIVETPSGEQFDNDDYDGALDRSLLVVQTRPGETYRVQVTSFAVGETGDYQLELRDEDSAAAAGVRTETGSLAVGDERLGGGEFYDVYRFSGVPGQRLRADLTSGDFDTYLVIESPTGDASRDDDGGGRVGHSRIEMDLTEPGTYTVTVTSYADGEVGDYRLALDLTERFGEPALAAAPRTGTRPPTATSSTTSPAPRVYSTSATSGLDLDQTITGGLDARDQRLASGEFMEVHTFDGQAGEPVRVEMSSDAFDTYLIVEAPSGDRIDNDDAEADDGSPDTGRSAVEFAMVETGRYRVIATSYRAGETGAYQIQVSQTDALVPEPLAYDKIVGLFVGISDYDRMSDLRWTAQDAVVARDAMIEAGMDPADGILLTDRDATADAVRSSLRRLAAQSDDRTLFVLFYSGHGGQYARADFQRADPDGLDESIELFDREILDDELDALLASVPASRQLVVLDACYSGGFSKDIISRPGRMGLFSSEEDIVSSVATKFEAGGYLSQFFADAVADRQADEDGNGAVTALELSHYLGTRFAADVQTAGVRRMRVAGDTRGEHQKLVVDRGSVGLYESLFQLRP